MSRSTEDRQPRARLEWLATGFGLGYAPKAPGTFGSLPGLILGWIILSSTTWLGPWQAPSVLAALVVAVLFSYCVIEDFETHHNTHDDQRIVIDEIVGQAIAVAMIGPGWLNLAVAFVLFRLFDITKPGPIGWADRRLPGAWGTLLDDVLAGAISGGVVVGLRSLGVFP